MNLIFTKVKLFCVCGLRSNNIARVHNKTGAAKFNNKS